MWFRLDTGRSANGEREGAPLPLNGPSASIWLIEDRLAISASAATVFALAIRRAALSRLVESARPSVLMQAAEYTPVGPSSNIAPLAGVRKKPTHSGA